MVQKSGLIFYMYSYTKKHDDVTSEKKLKQLDRPLVAACSKSPKLRPPEFYKSSFHTKSHLRVMKSGARTHVLGHMWRGWAESLMMTQGLLRQRLSTDILEGWKRSPNDHLCRAL